MVIFDWKHAAIGFWSSCWLVCFSLRPLCCLHLGHRHHHHQQHNTNDIITIIIIAIQDWGVFHVFPNLFQLSPNPMLTPKARRWRFCWGVPLHSGFEQMHFRGISGTSLNIIHLYDIMMDPTLYQNKSIDQTNLWLSSKNTSKMFLPLSKKSNISKKLAEKN